MALWDETDCTAWHAAIEAYPQRIKDGGTPRLVELDTWYRTELPELLASRQPAYVTRDELVRIVTWKMMRGVWRARNRQLVADNDAGLVEFTSTSAFAALPDLKKAINTFSELKGIGPATASAVLAAYPPAEAPFLDEAMALQVTELGEVAYTTGFYLRYTERLRARMSELNTVCTHKRWTAHDIDMALWSEAARLQFKE